jgi:glutamine amidotransferase
MALGSLLLRFAERGGKTADNPDGWGLAYAGDTGLILDKAPEPAAESQRFARLAEMVHSSLAIAHVRKANPPTERTVANTHPFLRECCGRVWVFAHNGTVPTLLEPGGCCQPHATQPSGATDSEVAFCFLLEEIAVVVAQNGADDAPWLETVRQLSAAIAHYGRFNFLLSDGRLLIAYGHDRLHLLRERAGDSMFAAVATEPLTPGDWEAFHPGALKVFLEGELLASME